MRFLKTRAALEIYDQERNGWEKMLDWAKTNADMAAWVAAREEGIDKVWEAFYEDNEQLSSLGGRMFVNIDWLRELARNDE